MPGSYFARVAAFSLAAMAALTFGAQAAGGLAFTSTSVNLRAGPGTDYDVIDVLPMNSAVMVEACTATWCAVTTEDDDEGFMYRTLLKTSPTGPTTPFSVQIQINPGGPFLNLPKPRPPKPPRPQPAYGEVCFYQQRDFMGANFCVEPGDKDRRIPGSFNDAIRSVSISGNIAARLCADADYRNCRVIDRSLRKLPDLLDRDITSYVILGGRGGQGGGYGDYGDQGGPDFQFDDSGDDGSDGGFFSIQ